MSASHAELEVLRNNQGAVAAGGAVDGSEVDHSLVVAVLGTADDLHLILSNLDSVVLLELLGRDVVEVLVRGGGVGVHSVSP